MDREVTRDGITGFSSIMAICVWLISVGLCCWWFGLSGLCIGSGAGGIVGYALYVTIDVTLERYCRRHGLLKEDS